jgi:hypothetical protein
MEKHLLYGYIVHEYLCFSNCPDKSDPVVWREIRNIYFTLAHVMLEGERLKGVRLYDLQFSITIGFLNEVQRHVWISAL